MLMGVAALITTGTPPEETGEVIAGVGGALVDADNSYIRISTSPAILGFELIAASAFWNWKLNVPPVVPSNWYTEL
jgi:hypothetical protein